MKQSTIIGTLLTFLMFLLILLAAVVFLWQGRQQFQTREEGLKGELDALQSTVETLNIDIINMSITLTISANDLATSNAETIRLSEQLVQWQQTVTAMQPIPLTSTAPVATPTPTMTLTNTPTATASPTSGSLNSNQITMTPTVLPSSSPSP